MDFEIFRSELDAALNRPDGVEGWRPPMEAVLMFKLPVIQALYGLSDAQAECQIMDRRTFGRCLGLDDGNKLPDGELRRAPSVRGPRRTSFGRTTSSIISRSRLRSATSFFSRAFSSSSAFSRRISGGVMPAYFFRQL